MGRRLGSTLIELLVTLAIMAIVATVATLALPRTGHTVSDTSAAARILEARHEAIERRQPVTLWIDSADARLGVTALPDGGVIADRALGIARLNGEGARASR